MIARSRAPSPAYEWDIFISYKRLSTYGANWIRKTLVGRLRSYLELINPDVRIGIDEEFIEAGDVWPKKLRHALAHSRVLVAIVSPAYFESEWCCLEMAIMMERHRRSRRNPTPSRYRLIVPVRIDNSGKPMPDCLKEIQITPLDGFFLQYFNNKMGKRLEVLANIIQERIEDSPAKCDPTWTRLAGRQYFRKLLVKPIPQKHNPRLVTKAFK